MKDISYAWVKFYNSGEWQITKFWTDSVRGKDKKMMKAVDWMSPAIIEDWKYSIEIGTSIKIPK